MDNIEYTLNDNKANKVGFIIIILILGLSIIPYVVFHRESLSQINNYFSDVKEISNSVLQFFYRILPLLIFFIGTCIHELLHGACFALFCKNNIKSVKFGFKLKGLIPYTHCIEALNRNYFIIGGLAPSIILGIFPLIYAFIYSNAWVWMFGFTSLVSCSGDFIYCYLLISKTKSKDKVLDHPEKMGFILDKNQ